MGGAANAVATGFQNVISNNVGDVANHIATGFQNVISTPVGSAANGFASDFSKFGENAFSGWGMGGHKGPSPTNPSPPSSIPFPSSPVASSPNTSSPYTGALDTTSTSNALSSMPGLTGANSISGLGSGYQLGNILGGMAGVQSNSPQGAAQTLGGIMGTDPYGTQIPLNNIPSTLAGNPSTGAIAPQTLQQILNNYINGQIAPTGYGMFDTGWRG